MRDIEKASFYEKKAATFLILIMIGSLMLIFNLQPSKATGPITIQWTNTYGTPTNATADSLEQTGDGGYVIAATNRSLSLAPQPSSALLIKTDSAGTVQTNQSGHGVFVG